MGHSPGVAESGTTERLAHKHGNSVFGFLENHQTVFHSGCASLHFYQQCMEILTSLHPPCVLLCFVLVSRSLSNR